VAIQKDNERLVQKQAALQSDNRVLEQTHDKLQQDNSQLEEQQEKLKSSIEQIVNSDKMLQRDVRKYDEEPEWQLPEPGAFASAKSFRDKKSAFPLVNKLKELVKNLTIQCVRLKEEILKLRGKIKNLIRDVEFYKGKVRDISNKAELLQEKADDLERVKRYAGAEQIDTIISKVKDQEHREQQLRQYNRSYGAR
jgi:chromosome segregation ATPase